MLGLKHRWTRLRALDPQLRIFLVGIVLLSISAGLNETTINNFLRDRFGLGAQARGNLEFPRELPGFLTALFAGLLFFVPETKIAALSALLVAGGFVGLAHCGTDRSVMLIFLVLWSAGTHLMMPLRNSISMELATKARQGTRLGQVRGVGIAGALIGCFLVWMIRPTQTANYRLVFMLGAVVALAASLAFLAMRLPNARLKRPRFVWHREYRLFYVLAFLFGARKHIFMTFGPWVLITVFDQPAHIFAQLWIVASVIGLWVQPLVGRLIDRLGERLVLMVDSALIIVLCAGYGFSDHLQDHRLALGILYACYVLDHLLFGLNMARATYMAKIAVKPEHITPTLSLGVSIDHVASMSMPAVGGLAWVAFGHSAVFIGAAGIAALMLVFANMIQTPGRGRAA